jgi:Family of unknown function (DUF6345)
MTEARPTQTPPAMETRKISYNGAALENPMDGGMAAVTGIRGGANMYGAFSMETFCDVGGLSYTHDDAQGWLDYVDNFTPLNFWYKDSGVRVWAYYEDYDNWQDTYGMDAVCAVYHSGHGGMDGNGVFYAPMGADWSGLGCTAVSSNMRLGNEHVKYIFWSTCLSCRVLDGQNPIKTWAPANLGFRMLFGFETTSWDDPNYGKFFWEEWNKNKSFSTAWLDASWRIAHDQAPSAVGCGATAEEAQNRVLNERYFYRDPVSHDWWWWRWYNAATASREPQRTVPQHLLIARLRPAQAQAQSARALADRFQMDMRIPEEVATAPGGSFRLANGDKSIVFGNDGSLEVQMAKPNLANRAQIATRRAISLAQEVVRRYGLDQQAPLVFDRILVASEGGGTAGGSGQLEGPYTTGTTVQFRQVINGVPVITPGAGVVRISIDNDGRVTSVHSSVRAIEQLSERPMTTTPAPAPVGVATPSQPSDPLDYEPRLAAEFSKRLVSWVVKGGMPLEFTTVPSSTEVGYDIRGSRAILIARKAVEVDFGHGYRKRYWVTVPLFE